MNWPRITTRWLMVAVLGLGLVLGLSIPAVEVYREKDRHTHGFVNVTGGKVFMTWAYNEQPPFWPRYARRLLGRPWKSQPVCGQGSGRIEETCAFDHPEMIIPRGAGQFSSRPTAALKAAYDRARADIEKSN